MSTEQECSGEEAGLGRHCHPACIACGDTSRGGLGLRFREEPDGSVSTSFPCRPDFQGYPGRLHGGVVSMLLDAAMTHSLFARHIRGVTAKLNIRFPRPVQVGVEATVRARLVEKSPPLYVLKAELLQHGEVCAHAEGKFFGEPIADTDQTSP